MLFFIKIPYRIHTLGRVVPAEEWILQKQEDGSLISTLRDYKNNLVKNYQAFQMMRGDAIQFNSNPALQDKEYLASGDTVGFINSNETLLELAELKRELALAKSNLEINITGEKQSLIDEARKQLELAKEKAGAQKIIMERQEVLVERDLIAREIFEITASTYRTYQLEAEIADAYLKSLLEGAKPQQVEYYQAEIKNIEHEIKILEERINRLSLIAPISGKLFHVFSQDTLILLGDTAMVAVIPVDIMYYTSLVSGQKVIVDLAKSSDIIIEGEIIKLDNRTEVLNGKQVFTIVVEIKDYPKNYPVNVIVGCSIIGERILLIDYLIRFLQSIMKV